MAVFSQMINRISVLALTMLIGNAIYESNPFYDEYISNKVYGVISENEIQRGNELVWRFKTENGYRYKRLYNTSTNQWVGDWILVGPV